MPAQLLRQALRFDRLHDAWLNVHANGGSAGGDHVTLQRFRHLLDEELQNLVDEVASATYRPGPARRVHLQTDGKIRALAVIPVRDRVLQRSVLDVLTPRVDRQFLHCSYGYRPGRSVQAAVQRVATLRDRGFGAIVDADIRDCFGSIDHLLLGEAIAGFVPDPALRELIAKWYLPQPGPLRPSRAPSRGINLGAPVSPLLCNMFLHRLDHALLSRRLQPVRYADDFVIACHTRAEAEAALDHVTGVLGEMKLTLNPFKTRLTSFAEGFSYLGVQFEGDAIWFDHGGARIDVAGPLPPEFTEWPSPYDRRRW